MQFKNLSQAVKYHAEKTPEKAFIIEGKTRYSYFQINKLMNSVCCLYKSLGLKKGDIISAVVKNSTEYVLLYLSSLRYGTIFNPYPHNLEPQDISRYAKQIDPKVFFCQDKHYSGLKEQKFNVFLVDDNFIRNLKESGEYPDFISKKDEPSCLYYSSGTTGNLKGILYSHKNMIALISSIIRGFRFTEDERHLIILPLGHTASTNYQFLPCVMIGSTMVITESFWKIRADFWKLVKKHNITNVQVVPSVLVGLLNTPYKETDYKNIDSLKYISCGSSTLSKELQIGFREKYGLPVSNSYGLSETGPSTVDYPLEEGWIEGSVGVELDVNKMKIEKGEILIKGDNVFVGYYKNTKLYKEAVKDGWFYSGDLGYKKDGKFYFLDRKKDLIIIGGANVLPMEIEEVLYKLKEIKECAVVGVEDKYLGEKIVSFVVLKDKEKITEQEIKDFCSKYLSEIKIPKKIKFVNELPKTPSGKILKRELRENG